jgi:exodeoxyribonuclease VII small subunit
MTAKNNDWSYEDARIRVKDILDTVERGDLPLTEVFERLELAAVDMQRCEEFLAEMQGRADLLVEALGD